MPDYAQSTVCGSDPGCGSCLDSEMFCLETRTLSITTGRRFGASAAVQGCNEVKCNFNTLGFSWIKQITHEVFIN